MWENLDSSEKSDKQKKKGGGGSERVNESSARYPVVKNLPASAGDMGFIIMEPRCCNYWNSTAPESVLHDKRSHHKQKPKHHNKDPARPKIKQANLFFFFKWVNEFLAKVARNLFK